MPKSETFVYFTKITSANCFENINIPVSIRVSNGTGQYNFSGQRDKVSSLSRDKGTTGQAQNLAKGRDGRDI